jgi:solute carrier family 35 protein E1
MWLLDYNSIQVQFWILDFVEPVTHAVANTAKRCLLIYAAVVYFNTVLTPLGVFGSSIAVLGTFLYAVSTSRS